MYHILIYLYLPPFILFCLGLIIGSFLNVVIYRLEDKKRKSLNGRSFCPHCRKTLKWYDMFPVLSWFLLRGRCRHCKKEISVQYPLVELSSGLVFSLIGIFFLQSDVLTSLNLVNLVFWLFFASGLIVIFVYDLKRQIIPNEIIYTILVAGLVYVGVNTFLGGNLPYLFDHLLSGLFAGAFFYLIASLTLLLLKKEGMGGGDIKLVTFMGLILGWQNVLVSLYVAFILGAIVGSIGLLANKKKIGSKIPFGPFLVVGTFIGLLLGGYLIRFYINMFM